MPYQSFLQEYHSDLSDRIAQQSFQVDTPPPVIQPTEKKVERRDYTLKSLEAQRLLTFGLPDLSGVTVNDETALSLPPIYAAANIISDGIAMLDRVVKGRNEKGIFNAEDHPIQLFMNGKPHPFYTWFDGLKALLVNSFFGNGFMRIWRDDFTQYPYALELIPSDMVYVDQINAQLWYQIDGFLNGRNVSVKIPYTDMIHIKGFTINGVNGRRLTLVHKPTFGAGLASQQYTNSVFKNQARPSIAIKQTEALESFQEAQQIEDNIMQRMSGENSGRPLVLDNGQDIVYLQWTPQDVAYIDFTRLNAEQVASMTKIPMEMLTSQKYGTRASSAQHNLNLLTHCYAPWIERIQEEFNSKLFYTEEYQRKIRYFEFDTSMYTALDKEVESKMLVDEVAGSIRTPNEARAVKGLPALPGGDELMVNINLLPISKAVEVALAKYLSSEGEKIKGDQGDNQTDKKDEPNAKPGN